MIALIAKLIVLMGFALMCFVAGFMAADPITYVIDDENKKDDDTENPKRSEVLKPEIILGIRERSSGSALPDGNGRRRRIDITPRPGMLGPGVGERGTSEAEIPEQ